MTNIPDIEKSFFVTIDDAKRLRMTGLYLYVDVNLIDLYIQEDSNFSLWVIYSSVNSAWVGDAKAAKIVSRPRITKTPGLISNPDWTRKPSVEDMARYYPDRALRMEMEGRTTLSCKVTAVGTLEACSVVSEDPAAQDFGSAALRMSKLFKMRPQTKDGGSVEGGTVSVPLEFSLSK